MMEKLATVKREIDNGEILQGLIYLHAGLFRQGYRHIVKHFFEDPNNWYAYADFKFEEADGLPDLNSEL